MLFFFNAKIPCCEIDSVSPLGQHRALLPDEALDCLGQCFFFFLGTLGPSCIGNVVCICLQDCLPACEAENTLTLAPSKVLRTLVRALQRPEATTCRLGLLKCRESLVVHQCYRDVEELEEKIKIYLSQKYCQSTFSPHCQGHMVKIITWISFYFFSENKPYIGTGSKLDQDIGGQTGKEQSCSMTVMFQQESSKTLWPGNVSVETWNVFRSNKKWPLSIKPTNGIPFSILVSLLLNCSPLKRGDLQGQQRWTTFPWLLNVQKTKSKLDTSSKTIYCWFHTPQRTKLDAI